MQINIVLKTCVYGYSGNKLIAYNGETCEYSGNTLTKWRNKAVEWQGRNLTKLGTNTFAYDGFNNRRRKNSIYFTYDSQDNLIEQSNGLHFMYDHTGVMGFTYQGQTYFYQKDLQGNIVTIVNVAGAPVAQYYYDAWGNHKVYDGDYITEMTSPTFIGNLNPFRYRGYYYDTETKLYYLQSRYYDPEVGRFISADQVEYTTAEKFNGLNLYAYCNNNPVMYVDPDGRFFGAIFGALMGALWAALGVKGNDTIRRKRAILVGAVVGFATGFTADAIAASGATGGTSLVLAGGFWLLVGMLGEFLNQTYVYDKPLEEVEWGVVLFSGVVNMVGGFVSLGINILSGAYKDVSGNVLQKMLSTLKPTADNIGEGLASGFLSGAFSSLGTVVGDIYHGFKELFK